jgi:hypothetical protein
LEVVVKGQQKTEADKEAAWRKKYQDEMKAKAAAGGSQNLRPSSGSGVERVAGDKDEKRDMGDIIRESIRNLR